MSKTDRTLFLPLLLAVAFLASFLGGCSGTRGTGGSRPIFGKLAARVDSQPIGGAEIVIVVLDANSEALEAVSTSTDTNGSFSAEIQASQAAALEFQLRVNEIDSAETVTLTTSEFTSVEVDLVLEEDSTVTIDQIDIQTPAESLPTTAAAPTTATTSPGGTAPAPVATGASEALPVQEQAPTPAPQTNRPTATPQVLPSATPVPAANQPPALPTNTPRPTPVTTPATQPAIATTAPEPPVATATQTPSTATGSPAQLAGNCLELLQAGVSTSGIYQIDPDGANQGLQAFEAYCDMTTDGGGWTLVLNYLHKGGTNPEYTLYTTRLPLLAGQNLGTDESGTSSWGHALPDLMRKLSFSEARFFCRSSEQPRVHFRTAFSGCVDYIRTGSGSCDGVENSFTELAGHSSIIPAQHNKNVASQDRDHETMVHLPVAAKGANWALGRLRGGDDWECGTLVRDDSLDTWHQVWIR